tara:strand:+ start:6076 stop:7980 length:1905 start_codon:yes stop_codon:yes gene_type:complete
MKICESHLQRFIGQNSDIKTLSKQLFQLGHENEIIDDILDIEITPNRGDCLSLLGLARDLNVLYETNCDLPIYEGDIQDFNLDFKNISKTCCPSICFLNISINELPNDYIPEVESYFRDLNIKKNNFFTDISNYVAYEIGQPTHCYDANMINGSITLSEEKINQKFLSLLDQEICLNEPSLIFRDDKDIINLAGIIGGKKTSCTSQTKNVIVESAYFNPESIIGKSTKYNINSEAAHKFERGVDPLMQEKALRRFIYLVQQHAEIENLKLYKDIEEKFNPVELDVNVMKINKILGTDIKEKEYLNILSKLGFKIDQKITIPSYRFDIKHQNDLAEEVARTIGYDDIKPIKFKPYIQVSAEDVKEKKIKQFLTNNGFYEVINMPFTKSSTENSVVIDNPLDVNRTAFRSELVDSLVMNLDFNERHQKDSIKLFEISNVYTHKKGLTYEKKLALLVSGKQGHNYKEFSMKLDKKYLIDLFKQIDFNCESFIKSVSREKITSKNKNPIYVFEINFDQLTKEEIPWETIKLNQEMNFISYKETSEYPSITRDISFSIENLSNLEKIENRLLGYKNENLKDSFIFDFYHNEKDKVIKLGFRFIFQSNLKTLTDKEVDDQINNIINLVKGESGVSVPGLF